MAVLASVAMETSHDKEANKAKMKSFVEKASAQGGDFIVFPEYVLAGIPNNPCLYSTQTMLATNTKMPS